jgi:hypothetical protein
VHAAREQREVGPGVVRAQAAFVERGAGALAVAVEVRRDRPLADRVPAGEELRRVERQRREHRPEVGVGVAGTRVVEVDDGQRVAVYEHLVDRRVAVAEAPVARRRVELGAEPRRHRDHGGRVLRRRERDPRGVVACDRGRLVRIVDGQAGDRELVDRPLGRAECAQERFAVGGVDHVADRPAGHELLVVGAARGVDAARLRYRDPGVARRGGGDAEPLVGAHQALRALDLAHELVAGAKRDPARRDVAQDDDAVVLERAARRGRPVEPRVVGEVERARRGVAAGVDERAGAEAPGRPRLSPLRAPREALDRRPAAGLGDGAQVAADRYARAGGSAVAAEQRVVRDTREQVPERGRHGMAGDEELERALRCCTKHHGDVI